MLPRDNFILLSDKIVVFANDIPYNPEIITKWRTALIFIFWSGERRRGEACFVSLAEPQFRIYCHLDSTLESPFQLGLCNLRDGSKTSLALKKSIQPLFKSYTPLKIVFVMWEPFNELIFLHPTTEKGMSLTTKKCSKIIEVLA